MSGGVEGLFVVISHTFPIYKQLSTQGTITSCSINKLDVKNHWVLRDLETLRPLVAPSLRSGATAQGL